MSFSRYSSASSASVVGDRDLAAVVAAGARRVVLVGLHVDEVDDAADLVLGADRDLGGDDVRAEGGLERLERAEEVGALAVEHVHEDHPRDVELGGALPQAQRRDLDAHDGVDDEDRRLADAQRAERVGDEARLAGRVEQVDLAVLPLEASSARRRSTSAAPARRDRRRTAWCRRSRCRAGWWRRPGTAAPRTARSCHCRGGRRGRRCGCGPPRVHVAAPPSSGPQGDATLAAGGRVAVGRHWSRRAPPAATSGARGRRLLVQARAQAQHGLGVQLGDARLGDAEDLADLAERQVLVVVERDRRASRARAGARSRRPRGP